MNEESVKNAIDIEAAKIDSREWAYAAIIARSEQHIKELEAEWKQKEDGWKRDNEPDWYIVYCTTTQGILDSVRYCNIVVANSTKAATRRRAQIDRSLLRQATMGYCRNACNGTSGGALSS